MCVIFANRARAASSAVDMSPGGESNTVGTTRAAQARAAYADDSHRQTAQEQRSKLRVGCTGKRHAMKLTHHVALPLRRATHSQERER